MKKSLLFLVFGLSLSVYCKAQHQVGVQSIYFHHSYVADYSSDTVSLIIEGVGLPYWGDIRSTEMYVQDDTTQLKVCYLITGTAAQPHLCTDTLSLGVFQEGIYNVKLFIAVTDGYPYDSCLQSNRRDTFDISFPVFNVTGLPQSTIANSQFEIFPNPATNQLFIETNGTPITEINLYNTTGVLVMAVYSTISNNQLSIVALPPGIYETEIKTKDATVMRRWVKM